MKFVHGYPLYALGTISVVIISEKEFEKVISSYINKAKSSKNVEQLQDAFTKMTQNLELSSQPYFTLMGKKLDVIMNIAIAADTDEAIRALNIMNFYVDLVSRLKAANLLTEKNQQQLQSREQDTVNNLLTYIQNSVAFNMGLTTMPFPIEIDQMLPTSTGRPLKEEDEEVDLSEAIDDGIDDESDPLDDVVDSSPDKETETDVASEMSRDSDTKKEASATNPEAEKGMSANTKIGLALIGGASLALIGALYLKSKINKKK
jgi:hypothetical protein